MDAKTAYDFIEANHLMKHGNDKSDSSNVLQQGCNHQHEKSGQRQSIKGNKNKMQDSLSVKEKNYQYCTQCCSRV